MTTYWPNYTMMPPPLPYSGSGPSAAAAVMQPAMATFNPYAPPKLTMMANSPEGYPVYCYTLRNGHRVIIEERPTDQVGLRTFIKAGSVYEQSIHKSPYYRPSTHPSGIAHLDEHCHFLTTQNFPKKNDWVRRVESYGTRLNASTSDEFIQHQLFFNKEDLSPMLELHAEAILRPKYNDADISQEKSNVLNEISKNTAPVNQRLGNKLMELLLDRPFFQTLGYRADVQNATAKQLQHFYDTFYRPDNMITVISGRVSPMTISQVDRLFGNNPPRPATYAPEALKCALRPLEIRSKTLHDPSLTNSIVKLAFPGPEMTNTRERMAMEFLVDALGVSPTSLLEQQVKDRQRLVSEVSIGYTSMNATGIVDCTMSTAPGKEQEALRATLQQVRTMAQWSLSPEKLLETKNRLKYAFQAGLNNTFRATESLGVEALAGSLDYYLHYERLLDSVTTEDIRQVAQKYLDTNRYAVVFGVQGPANSQSGGYHS